MDSIAAYRLWAERATEDPDLQTELRELEGKEGEISDRFYRDLAFGTGGLRGVVGAGSNRMNLYTVRRATQGLADYLNESGLPKTVAIARDSRLKGELFCREAACVLAANSITVWMYPRLEPTPALSWAVRYNACGAGICVTASHNPAKYNGYKVYGPDGCQITPEAADRIYKAIGKTDLFDGVKRMDYDEAVQKGLIRVIPDKCLEDYVDAVLALRPGNDVTALRLVYTPLNGAGLECVRLLLKKMGVAEVAVVPEQERPDGHFPTCPYPNPEIREAMDYGLALCDKLQPDLLIGTDPDCDRMGCAVRDSEGHYSLIGGNEMGVLLLDYLCRTRLERGSMPENPVAVSTIVSTPMASAVAAHYGVELRRTLTGFKYIGEQIGLLEKEGHPERFVFGFEESYGYLSGTHVRDKDAVNAVMLACEAAAWYRKRGMSLLDGLEELYQRYGYYRSELLSYAFEGADGMAAMSALMRTLRDKPPARIGAFPVVGRKDYAKGEDGLLPADVLEFALEGGARLTVRPSGTEPKLKLYLSVKGASGDEAEAKLRDLTRAARALIDSGIAAV